MTINLDDLNVFLSPSELDFIFEMIKLLLYFTHNGFITGIFSSLFSAIISVISEIFWAKSKYISTIGTVLDIISFVTIALSASYTFGFAATIYFYNYQSLDGPMYVDRFIPLVFE